MKSVRRRMLAGAFSGAVAALGHAPFSVPLATVIALACAVALLARADDLRSAAWLGWATGCGYFGVALHWIIEPFLVDVARHGWMAPFALVFMSGGLALFWAGAFATARWLAGSSGSALRLALSPAVCLAAAETARSFVLTGFPWALPAYVWTETSLRLLVAWIGPFGLTFATLAVVSALSLSLIGTRHMWRLVAAGFAMALLFAAYGWTSVLERTMQTNPSGKTVRIVQPNEPQNEKWLPENVQRFWLRKLELTEGDGPVDLVIWPEVSLPYLLERDEGGLSQIGQAAGGAAVILGAQRLDGNDRLLNSLVMLDHDGEPVHIYDKQHLVPFGEYFPGGELARRLGLEGLATNVLGGFSAGVGPRLRDASKMGLGSYVPMICYETIFPRYARSDEGRADWLVQLTNDAWFGNFAGPQQHLQQARMRAIEQGLPLIRAANTGISALIDPQGRIVARLDLNETGALEAGLPASSGPTFYARVGDWPVWGLMLLCLSGLALTRERFGH
ncbi:apolipoprotein N-acyltransferase [Qingshengfaniella alkalisoli]|uniref:apolipoprotein N-acyltransferase n=1 Tax=Qingshengfaniella alkalisoli TaxID=2599296 RepID=UPI001F1146B1|nr:apolipoprotein N-acyltransferase [Qingshengfaniella alkalisoli]